MNGYLCIIIFLVLYTWWRFSGRHIENKIEKRFKCGYAITPASVHSKYDWIASYDTVEEVLWWLEHCCYPSINNKGAVFDTEKDFIVVDRSHFFRGLKIEEYLNKLKGGR